MNSPKSKVQVGVSLLTLFLITVVTGIILHLKKHGIVVEPRPVIKIIHWSAGFIMACLTFVHGKQFWKMFSNMKQRFRWFWCDTLGVILFVSLTVLTGLVKILSPVKIPHLGLWHYSIGIAMTVVIILHLFRGIPSLNRLIKVTRK